MGSMHMTPGLIIAGTHSGCGKTTVTLALMAALRKRGLSVAPFKIGPDFIDPGHHARICNRPSHNLDGWMLEKQYIQHLFYKSSIDANCAIIEGVMGLFDGAQGSTLAGSTAEIALWLDLPVLLVVDARSLAGSVAALVHGYTSFKKNLRFAGVILNRVGSKKHAEILIEALQTLKLPWIGYLERDDRIKVPSRHLGLVTSEDSPWDANKIHALTDWLEKGCNLPELWKILSIPGPTCPGTTRLDNRPGNLRHILPANGTDITRTNKKRKGATVRIAVAMDEAFSFYYQDNLELLQQYGAELAYFSPIRDARLPKDISGLYLGGGYPELHGNALGKNQMLIKELVSFAEKGMPIYAECGGMLYLCKRIVPADKMAAPLEMAGLFPLEIKMYTRRRALGYREATVKGDFLLGPTGAIIRGHEFHYSDMGEAEASASGYLASCLQVKDSNGRLINLPVLRYKNVFASYLHLHFGSFTPSAQHLVQNAMQYQSMTQA